MAPHLQAVSVDGAPRQVHKNSVATLDVIQLNLARMGNFRGVCTSMRQVVESQSVCLSVEQAAIKGCFVKLKTEALVLTRGITTGQLWATTTSRPRNGCTTSAATPGMGQSDKDAKL